MRVESKGNCQLGKGGRKTKENQKKEKVNVRRTMKRKERKG